MIVRDYDADDLDDDEWDDDPEDDETTAPCPHCGASIHDDAERCPDCGRYLSREDDPTRKALVGGPRRGRLPGDDDLVDFCYLATDGGSSG